MKQYETVSNQNHLKN